MPQPYSDLFSHFLEILRSRNRDLKTTHITFWGCRVYFHAFFPTTTFQTAVPLTIFARTVLLHFIKHETRIEKKWLPYFSLFLHLTTKITDFELTASSGTSSSVLTVNGQNPLMCLILKKEIWGTLPSCLSKSNVQVLADFAPRGMRVRSSVRSPVEHNMTVCKVPRLWSNWLEISRHFLTDEILDARPSQLQREHFPALKTGHTLLQRFLIGSWHDYVSNDRPDKKVLYKFTN